MAEDRIELLQFAYSHYNEKARWALDYKGIPHVRQNYLPGLHAGAIKKLTGRTEVPVVRFGTRIVPGSAAIIDELERLYPAPALYPSDPAERERALAIQRWFDDYVGPMVRRSIFSVLVDELGYTANMFSTGKSRPVRLYYRAVIPFARNMIKTGMGIIDPASIEESFRVTREGLDFVAKEAGTDGYLVGDRFTVADLAAAALLAPAANPPHPDMARPEPMPQALQHWSNGWKSHDGVKWVHGQYAKHRPRSLPASDR